MTQHVTSSNSSKLMNIVDHHIPDEHSVGGIHFSHLQGDLHSDVFVSADYEEHSMYQLEGLNLLHVEELVEGEVPPTPPLAMRRIPHRSGNTSTNLVVVTSYKGKHPT